MVTIINRNGIEFDVSLEMADKFIQAGDIDGYYQDGNFIYGERRYVPEPESRRKNIIRKI